MRYKGIRTDTKPWYKYFWPWFILAVIFWSFMSGASMLFFANHNPYSMVDGFDKIGKVITSNEKHHQKALELGIRGVLVKKDKRFKLMLTPKKYANDYKHLHLTLIHPTTASKDQTIKMHLVKGQLLSEEATGLAENTKVKLSSSVAGWAIVGNLNKENEIILK